MYYAFLAYTLNGQPLQDMSGDLVAFKGFPRDQMYVPAVTLFLGEKVQLILDHSEVCVARMTN